ncbi:tetratricopeptide repeat protein [bacterium]|nr:tetratricopeptide repeat protein [bacterium]
MRKISVFVLTTLLGINIATSAEPQTKAPAQNSAVEIERVFVDSKNYEPQKSKKIQAKQKIEKPVQTKKEKAEPKKEKTATKKSLKEKFKKTETPKETVTTSSLKEVKEQAKQEEIIQRRRELQELTNLNKQAVALYTDNNLKESLNTFAKIPEDKRTPEIWLLMGNILMDQGKKDEAVFMYGRAILVEPTYYKAYYNLGNIYLSEDKFNMAIEQYKQATKYTQTNPYVFYNLGCAYLKLGDLKKAKVAYLRALEIKNTIPEIHYNLAYVFKKLKKEKQAKLFLSNYNKLTGEI